MALRMLMNKKNLDKLRKDLAGLIKRETDLADKFELLKKREAEAEAALEEITEESTEDEKKALEDEATEIDTARESLESENELLKKEKSELEAKIAELETELKDEPERSAIPQEVRKENKNMIKFEPDEKRGKDLIEKRTVTIATTGVILPEFQATDIKPTFNEVSSIVDNVDIKPFIGGESFKQPYLKGYDIADYETEGGTSVGDIDPTFGYAEVTKTKLVAYTEDSEELLKLPAANFDAEVVKGISIAERKKLAKEILVGDGESGHFVGIFDNGATAIDPTTDIDFAEIDEDTLDEIIYSFGGNEDVEDLAVLILNKKDLKAFAMLRDSNGKKIYDIQPKGNFGTIDGVPYIINSNCKAISDPATTTGQYAMAYGPLSNYTMAIFSDLQVSRSTDYKFKEGMIAHRGVIFAGGNVTAHNGFLRVKRT